MINLPKLQDFEFKEKTVLVRMDLDIPPGEDFRLKAGLPTIEYLLKNKAKIILMGHLGRPEGKVIEELKLAPIAEKLKGLLKLRVKSEKLKVQLKIQNFPVYILDENLWLLENLRFYPGEEKNDLEFAKNLSLLGDFYANEAFAASHREHASIVGIPKFLPSCFGFNFAKEVENLSKVLENPKKPVVFIIGGAKPETKLPLVAGLMVKSDFVLLGGLLPQFKNKELKIKNNKKVVWGKLTEDSLDIEENSIKKFKEIIQKAGTIVWNGPMGKFEAIKGARGTKEIAKTIAQSKAFKVVGGGDTIAALKKFWLLSKIDFVSTGGGAMLEYLAKGTLPGIEAVSHQPSVIRKNLLTTES